MEQEDKCVEIGVESVIIDKCYGSTIFANLRITPNLETCEWIIERWVMFGEITEEIDENGVPYTEIGSTDKYVEWCRIPGQFSWEHEEPKKRKKNER